MVEAWRPGRAQARNWALAAEAALWLTLAGLALRTLPFARIAALAGIWPRRERGPCIDPDGRAAQRIGWAVEAAARRAPWPALCFEQGLAAHLMLRRRGWQPTLCYGARSDGAAGPSAHVWVRLDGRDVVGGEEAHRYALLATFPEPRAGAPVRSHLTTHQET